MFVARTLRTVVKIVVIDIKRTRRMRTVFERVRFVARGDKRVSQCLKAAIKFKELCAIYKLSLKTRRVNF